MPSGRRKVSVMHRCEKCGVEYEWWNTRAPKGKCRKCNQSPPEWFAANHRRKKYGLTPPQYAAMLEAQDNRCAICHRPFLARSSPNVDHNHATGANRDLLCGDCNRGLGCFVDRPEWLRRAAEYLERHAVIRPDTLNVRVDPLLKGDRS